MENFMTSSIKQQKVAAQIQALEQSWAADRYAGITRPYSAADVVRLRPSMLVDHTHARLLAEKLWTMLTTEKYVATFGAMFGMQAIQMVKAGIKSLYLSGWQVAGGNNSSGEIYPDQSLYTADSGPKLTRELLKALERADQIDGLEDIEGTEWMVPIVADAEAGFGGKLNAFELMRAFIAAGAAGVHFEDQLAAEKKCGHLGGKVLRPTKLFQKTLIAARLAADFMGVDTVIIARTDSLDATLLESDIDPEDREFITGTERTSEGFWRVTGGIKSAIKRGLAFAPYADLLWFETGKPDLEQAKQFADAIHAVYPGKMLAYNCSPSFNWKRNLCDADIARFQTALAAMGYKFQFITLAGWHVTNLATFELARGYVQRGMPAYVEVQEAEFAAASKGYTAAKHQREVGTGWFDAVAELITSGESSTSALAGSTETEQFH